MTVYEQKLWFDSCAADTAVSLLIFVLICGGLAIGIRHIRDLWPESSCMRIRTYLISVFIYFLWGVALASCAAYVFDRGWERTIRLAGCTRHGRGLTRSAGNGRSQSILDEMARSGDCPAGAQSCADCAACPVRRFRSSNHRL
jgi:hypothetical protein